MNLVRRRLRNQRLFGSDLRRAPDVVRWLGAVQAQDYAAAKWALGLRAPGLTDADVERAFDEGAILRTHLLRPTWHFVAPADIRWMLALTAPRVQAANAYYDRTLGLDARTRRRSLGVLERALRGGRALTRAELGLVLRRAGIPTEGLRLTHLMADAELEGLVVSGPRKGKQFTYALLEERVPRAPSLSRVEALAELTRRYFESHGPATLRDFAWWSGLKVQDARTGIGHTGLDELEIDGRAYFFHDAGGGGRPSSAHFLPNFDEYLVAYKDRGPVVGASEGDALGNVFVLEGKLAGTWKPKRGEESVAVEAFPYRPLSREDRRKLASSAERYGRFLGLRVRLSLRKS
jgi:hypothetical protein